MAGVTGLEPAASGVTGRRSNQLSYTPLETGTYLFAVVPWFLHRTTPKMLLIRQEFKKKYPAPLLRQTSITLKQQKPHPATNSALFYIKYISEKHSGMVGGEGFEPPTYSV
jgi:hypothetical protein